MLTTGYNHGHKQLHEQSHKEAMRKEVTEKIKLAVIFCSTRRHIKK